MTMGDVPGTFFSLSDSGWMNAELFQEEERVAEPLSGACSFMLTSAAPPR